MVRKSREGRGPVNPEAEFKKTKPRDRVRMALEMSSLASALTLQSIRDRNPKMSKAKLIEAGRKRLYSGRKAS